MKRKPYKRQKGPRADQDEKLFDLLGPEGIRRLVRKTVAPMIDQMAGILIEARDAGVAAEKLEASLAEIAQVAIDRLSKEYGPKVVELAVAELKAGIRQRLDPPTSAGH